jgi:hypothetical protein
MQTACQSASRSSSSYAIFALRLTRPFKKDNNRGHQVVAAIFRDVPR